MVYPPAHAFGFTSIFHLITSNAFPLVKHRNMGLRIHVTVYTFKETVALESEVDVLEMLKI